MAQILAAGHTRADGPFPAGRANLRNILTSLVSVLQLPVDVIQRGSCREKCASGCRPAGETREGRAGAGQVAVGVHSRGACAPLRRGARGLVGGAAGSRHRDRAELRRPGGSVGRGIPRSPGSEEAEMILTDAGPLIAILDRGEEHHQACVECLAELAGPMLTTWPAFTEAMYLLGEAGGWLAQDTLWALVEQ